MALPAHEPAPSMLRCNVLVVAVGSNVVCVDSFCFLVRYTPFGDYPAIALHNDNDYLQTIESLV